jgi:nicotinate-nucleotide pyrophosphorylase (carboxylating)
MADSVTREQGSVDLQDDVVQRQVQSWLAEDGASNDVTTNWCVDAHRSVSATIIAKSPGVVAGLAVGGCIFRELEPDAEVTPLCEDGARVTPGQELLRITAGARTVLTGERPALNILQRMSGIATLTDAFVTRLRPMGVRVFDTRKTAPGLRIMDKYAVRVGGGETHRTSLSSAVLIKENHATVAGGVAAAIHRVAAGIATTASQITCIVEVENLREFAEAMEAGARWIMLDNFDAADAERAVAACVAEGRREITTIEASGNLDLARVDAFALAGVDIVSVGALTHSVSALDLSLRLEA